MVPEAGLEPARPYGARDFKSLMSTNSITPALLKDNELRHCAQGRKVTLGPFRDLFNPYPATSYVYPSRIPGTIVPGIYVSVQVGPNGYNNY